MTHDLPLAREKKGDNKTTTYSGWGRERPRQSLLCARGGKDNSNVAYDQVCCMYPPFVECYAVHSARHLTTDPHTYQNCSWLLLSFRTLRSLFSQPLCPKGGTRKLQYHRGSRRPLPAGRRQRRLRGGLDLPSHFLV